MIKLRRGKAKNILDASIDSALLAVEIYNKPRAPFRVQNYVSLMVMSWTRLFHTYFHATIGDKYYYKDKRNNRKYVKVNGEKKAWELTECIKQYKKLGNELDNAAEKNLEFFIILRNKIEHRYIDKNEIDTIIFGECQALLYNYENMLIDIFGEEYAINESLAYSLQFSNMRNEQQIVANKKILSEEMKDITNYIDKYRTALPDDLYDDQAFSIKLIQVPKIANSSRYDLAVEFVKWDETNKHEYNQLTAIVKDKVVKKDVRNAGKLKPKDVIDRVNSNDKEIDLNQYTHQCLYYIFSIRPSTGEDLDPYETNTKYCHYDEAHDDYVYKDEWVGFIIKLFNDKRLNKEQIKNLYRDRDKLDIREFEN
jgi:hypothetical protein